MSNDPLDPQINDPGNEDPGSLIELDFPPDPPPADPPRPPRKPPTPKAPPAPDDR